MLIVFFAGYHIGKSENMGTSGIANLHVLANHFHRQITPVVYANHFS